MRGENKTPVHRWLLWAALACALLASWSHVVAAFARLEHGGAPAWLARVGPLAAVLAAVALDLGLIALAWGIGQRRRLGRPAGDLWAAVAVFAGLSAFANANHALGVVLKGQAVTWAAVTALDGWTLASVIGLAAALPLLALWLARVVELDVDIEAEVERTRAAAAAAELDQATTAEHGPDSGESQNGQGPGSSGTRKAPGSVTRRKAGPRKAEPADLAAAVQLDPSADVTTLAGRLGVSRPTVYAWAGALGLYRDDAGRWTADGAAVQSN